MSRYSGPQGRGARRRAREKRRAQAEARNALTPAHRRARARRACPAGKVKYRSEHEARCELVGAIVSKNRGNGRRHEIRVYQCNLCGSWHLTSRPDRKPVRSWMFWRRNRQVVAA